LLHLNANEIKASQRVAMVKFDMEMVTPIMPKKILVEKASY